MVNRLKYHEIFGSIVALSSAFILNLIVDQMITVQILFIEDLIMNLYLGIWMKLKETIKIISL